MKLLLIITSTKSLKIKFFDVPTALGDMKLAGNEKLYDPYDSPRVAVQAIKFHAFKSARHVVRENRKTSKLCR